MASLRLKFRLWIIQTDCVKNLVHLKWQTIFLSRKIPHVLWSCVFCNGGTKRWQLQGSSLSLHWLLWKGSTCDCHHGGWPFLLPGQGAPAGDVQWKLIVFEMMHLPDGRGLWLVCCSLWPQRGWLGWLDRRLSSLQVIFGNTIINCFSLFLWSSDPKEEETYNTGRAHFFLSENDGKQWKSLSGASTLVAMPSEGLQNGALFGYSVRLEQHLKKVLIFNNTHITDELPWGHWWWWEGGGGDWGSLLQK